MADFRFNRGITEDFVNALLGWEQWKKIAVDKELHFAVRNKYVNVYYQGCSIFNISYSTNGLRLNTHYKYLINPEIAHPYIDWDDGQSAITQRGKEIFIDGFNINLLKKAASRYAGAEKKGIQSILQSNANIVDVEIAISNPAEKQQDSEDAIEGAMAKSDAHADRIDFVALQRINGKAHIVFFEAKRFDNKELRANGADVPVLDQIKKYEKFIGAEDNQKDIKESYRQICENLHQLAPERWDTVVKEIAQRAIDLEIAHQIRLVVFGFDKDQRDGNIWKAHKQKLAGNLKDRLLLIGNPKGFKRGISNPEPKARA